MELYILRFVREVPERYVLTPDSAERLWEDPYAEDVRYEVRYGGEEYMYIALPKELAEDIINKDLSNNPGPDANGWVYDDFFIADLYTVSSIYEIFPTWPRKEVTEDDLQYDDDDADLPL
jgi:hypothetical protein